MEWVYLYCIYLKGRANPKLAGLEAVDPALPALELLKYEKIGAIISHVGEDFNPEQLEAKTCDLTWLKDRACRHDHLISQVALTHSTLPCKFCTIFTSRDKVLDLLKADYEAFYSRLCYLKKKQEWGIKVICLSKELAKIIEAKNAKLQALKEQMSGERKGKNFFLQKKLEADLARESEQLISEFTGKIQEELAALAVESMVNKLIDESVFTGEKVDVVFNGSYLVEATKKDAFFTKVQELQASEPGRAFQINLQGPLPPYHFS